MNVEVHELQVFPESFGVPGCCFMLPERKRVVRFLPRFYAPCFVGFCRSGKEQQSVSFCRRGDGDFSHPTVVFVYKVFNLVGFFLPQRVGMVETIHEFPSPYPVAQKSITMYPRSSLLSDVINTSTIYECP